MLGTIDHPAGASTLLHTVKNPITLAKALLLDPDKSPHIFLGGSDAEKYAKANGLELVDPKYFWTENILIFERAITDSKLSGPIPTEIGNLTSLTQL